MKEAFAVKNAEDQTEDGRQYVTFGLNDETYAIEATAVQEIVELMNITKVPHLPDYFKGVINLRGAIIPVVDLKMKFEMASEKYKRHTCVIITEFSKGVIGLVVDIVSDVLNIPDHAISGAPSFGNEINTGFIKGMARVNDNLVIVLDVNEVLSEDDTLSLNAARDAVLGAVENPEKL